MFDEDEVFFVYSLDRHEFESMIRDNLKRMCAWWMDALEFFRIEKATEDHRQSLDFAKALTKTDYCYFHQLFLSF